MKLNIVTTNLRRWAAALGMVGVRQELTGGGVESGVAPAAEELACQIKGLLRNYVPVKCPFKNVWVNSI